MKLLPFLVLLFFSTSSAAQQNGFYHVEPTDSMVVNTFGETLEQVFRDPGAWHFITINVEELRFANTYDFSTLTNLESVQVKFTLCPDSSDRAKKIYRMQIDSLVKNMQQFAKCPKLKSVVFCIGEQIYLSKSQCKPVGKEKKEYEAFWKRTSDQNLAEAWKDFGSNVNRLLPGVVLYAYNWEW